MNDCQLTDVTLRDGLQAEGIAISLDRKIKVARALDSLGYDRLEITGFAHPKWIPQLADADEFCQQFLKVPPRTEVMAFVPNLRGLERAIAFEIPWISMFVAVSETFNKKNVNLSIQETVFEIERVYNLVKAKGRKLRVYVSAAFGCPYEGEVNFESLERLFGKLRAFQCDEVVLSDTIGVATPSRMASVVKVALKYFAVESLVVHLHDTYGMAVANCEKAWELGVRRFDGSTGGIGGCPYAQGSTGNVATENIWYLMSRSGRRRALSQDALQAAHECLKDSGLSPKSSLSMILSNGGRLYGS